MLDSLGDEWRCLQDCRNQHSINSITPTPHPQPKYERFHRAQHPVAAPGENKTQQQQNPLPRIWVSARTVLPKSPQINTSLLSSTSPGTTEILAFVLEAPGGVGEANAQPQWVVPLPEPGLGLGMQGIHVPGCGRGCKTDLWPSGIPCKQEAQPDPSSRDLGGKAALQKSL